MKQNTEEIAKKNNILRVVAGSHAYGTNINGSDWDERGIFADTMERVILPFEKIETVQCEKDDVVYYELSKYMPLLLKQNPNVLEILWVDKKDIIEKNECGDILIDNKKEFLSIEVKDKYVAYAIGQLNRIKGHNGWINNPQPENPPIQKDYISVLWNNTDIKEYNKTVPVKNYIARHIGNHVYGLWKNQEEIERSWINKDGIPVVIPKEKEFLYPKTPSLIVKLNMNEYEEKLNIWKNYWTWKKNRNEKRGELETKFGYDTKHAMHLVRLLKSGIEILENNVVPVKREDASFLIDIRNGIYSYDEILKIVKKLEEKINIISTKSNLPKTPNIELGKEIMLCIYKKMWGIESLDLKNKIKKC